jgi:glycosyltransferase involved in cell wall biosynthesis
MLRSIDDKGGIGIYTRYITQELIELDKENEYILFYSHPANIGRFAHRANVTERHLKTNSKAIWDQVNVPIACLQEKIDVVFHPKFTVPIMAPCKTVMVLHGAGWFIPEFQQFWEDMDLRYIGMFMPIYCRRASAILSVSQLTTDIFARRFNLPSGKVRTVYFAPGRHFRRISDNNILHAVREKYNLPRKFIFTLSGYDRGDRKNIGGILEAFKLLRSKSSHKLVIGGRDCYKFKSDYGIPDDGYGGDIMFLGWVEQEDLPAIYSLADLFLYPSHMEAFPIPITEALACGTPIVTSNAYGLVEIVGDAAELVDPKNSREIAAAVSSILSDEDLQNRLSEKALVRSQRYSWDKCARATLATLQSVVS